MQSPRNSVSCSSLWGLDGKGNESNGCFPSAAVPQVMPDYGFLPFLVLGHLFLLLQDSSISLSPPETLICFVLSESPLHKIWGKPWISLPCLCLVAFSCVLGGSTVPRIPYFVSLHITGHSCLIWARIKIHETAAIVFLSDCWKSGVLFTALFLVMCSSVLCISPYLSECK